MWGTALIIRRKASSCISVTWQGHSWGYCIPTAFREILCTFYLPCHEGWWQRSVCRLGRPTSVQPKIGGQLRAKINKHMTHNSSRKIRLLSVWNVLTHGSPEAWNDTVGVVLSSRCAFVSDLTFIWLIDSVRPLICWLLRETCIVKFLDLYF